MNVILVKNDQDLAKKAYEKIQEAITLNPNAVLGMATGGSPLGIYELMRENKPNTKNVTTINLDEYVNLPFENETSYHHYMKEVLFNALPFKKTYLPNGMEKDLQASCEAYERIIAENPIDLQLLGIGENGHIGFNEPGTPFDSVTHIVELTESTKQANARYFENEADIPTHAITMGISSIMKAKHIVLVATGKKKAEAINKMLTGEITEDCPATILQKHPNVTVIVDEGALSDYNRAKKNMARTAGFKLFQSTGDTLLELTV